MIKKIFYIEDELDSHVIIDIFRPVLNPMEINEIENSENDNESIFQAICQNNRLDITSCFTEAIFKLNNIDEYELIIIDRNLFGDGTKYRRQDVPTNLYPSYEDYYSEREGDFLIHMIHNKHYDIDKKLFILTGNDDPIRDKEEFRGRLSEQFKLNNIISKGSSGIEKIQTIVKDTVARLHIKYTDILNRYVYDKGDAANRFLKIIEDKDNEIRIGDNLTEMRTIYSEKILKECYRRIPQMEVNCKQNGKFNKYKGYRWLEDNKHINAIQRSFFEALYNIGSAFGPHAGDSSQIYKPTTDTVNSLLYALRDVIQWFEFICIKYPK